MDRRTLLKYLSIGVAGTSLTTAVQSLASASGGTAAWGYTGSTGPNNWGSLDPAYAVCGSGTRQSPINLNTGQAIDATPTDFVVSYQSFQPTIVNTGKTIQVNCPNPSQNTLTLDGKTFKLEQFHFHAPAEHTKDTLIYDMELHGVHVRRDASNNIVEIAVIGVLMEVGSYNADIHKIFSNMPTSAGSSNSPSGVSIKFEDLFPEKEILNLVPLPLKYYRYNGSLTTPPCSEIVNWILYDKPIQISQQQLNQFEALYDDIARPVQSTNGRFLLEDKLT